MRYFSLLMLLWLSAASSGCVFFIPTGELKTFRSRTLPGKEQLEFLRPGITTKEDVLFNLGEPDIAWDEEKNFLYWSHTRQHVLGFLIAGAAPGACCAGASAPAFRYGHAIVMRFDANNVLARYKLKSETFSGQEDAIVNSIPRWIYDVIDEWHGDLKSRGAGP